jgi:hemerythrin superfamily protein
MLGKLRSVLMLAPQAPLGEPNRVRRGRTVRMTHVVDVHRPVSGDVIDLILADHALFETLLRQLRDASADRAAVRDALANVLVAHAEAEEKHVYPKLRKRSAVGAHEAEHSEEEHAEGHEALLKVLELKGTDTKAFDDAVEELSGTINHHLVEEELTILNPARSELGSRALAELGAAFAAERNRQIDANCGAVTNVRKLVARSRREGKLDDD